MSSSSAYRPWFSDKEQEKQYKMTRGLTQDVGKKLKESIKKTYPSKKTKNKKGEEIDLSDSCTEWHYDVVMFFGEDPEKQAELLDEIRDAYRDERYLDEDEDWLEEYAESTIIFSKEIKTYAQIPRLAFKDSTEKPKNDVKIKDWWKRD